MANIGRVLKDEIQRLAKKESKRLTAELKESTVALKHALAKMKRQFVQLQREVRLLSAAETRRSKQSPAVAPEQAEKLRFSAKGVRALRRKLKLSQADFAKLVDVSALAVYQWERKQGRLGLRQATRNKLAGIRGLGRREALKRLEEKPASGKKAAAKPGRKRKKK